MLVPSLYRDTRRQTAVRTYSLGHNPPVPETVAIIDFETTGMSPSMGARATEVAAVLVHGGEIVGRFQSLMKSGAWVPPFIEQLTGISNAMLERAPPARAVMHELLRFTKGVPLVAHNAAFDRGFWQAEAERAECEPDEAHRFACTLLLSRRLHPEAPNHRLGTLRAWHALPDAGRAHRALADAETTAHLFIRQQRDAAARFAATLDGRTLGHELLLVLQKASRARLGERLARHLESVRRAWNHHEVEPVAGPLPSLGKPCAERFEPARAAALEAMPAR
jgi:DNA polymerase-3 subunit epsilon